MSHERRREVREPANYSCWLSTESTSRLIQGRVSNISAGGAMVVCPAQAEIPDSLELYMTPDGKVGRRCKVVWRSDNAIGLQFLARATLQPAAEIVEL